MKNINFEKIKNYGPAVVRMGLALVFLWFGLNQLFDPGSWIGWVPGWIHPIVHPAIVVFVNGLVEVILGTILLLGFFTRTASLILGLHLLGIAFSIGYSATMIRDLGLAIATLSITLTGPDKLCLSNKFKKN